jgi:hypothetical protein
VTSIIAQPITDSAQESTFIGSDEDESFSCESMSSDDMSVFSHCFSLLIIPFFRWLVVTKKRKPRKMGGLSLVKEKSSPNKKICEFIYKLYRKGIQNEINSLLYLQLPNERV